MGVSLASVLTGAGIEGKLLRLLIKRIEGEMDGKPLNVSPASSGRKLVIKGWRRDDKRIAVRYGTDWDDLDGGTITYQAAGDDGFKPTTGGRVVASAGGLKLTLKLTFTDRQARKHTAKFWAELI